MLHNIAAYAHLDEDQVRSAVADQLTQSSSEESLPSTSSGICKLQYLSFISF